MYTLGLPRVSRALEATTHSLGSVPASLPLVMTIQSWVSMLTITFLALDVVMRYSAERPAKLLPQEFIILSLATMPMSALGQSTAPLQLVKKQQLQLAINLLLAQQPLRSLTPT